MTPDPIEVALDELRGRDAPGGQLPSENVHWKLQGVEGGRLHGASP